MWQCPPFSEASILGRSSQRNGPEMQTISLHQLYTCGGLLEYSVTVSSLLNLLRGNGALCDLPDTQCVKWFPPMSKENLEVRTSSNFLQLNHCNSHKQMRMLQFEWQSQSSETRRTLRTFLAHIISSSMQSSSLTIQCSGTGHSPHIVSAKHNLLCQCVIHISPFPTYQ